MKLKETKCGYQKQSLLNKGDFFNLMTRRDVNFGEKTIKNPKKKSDTIVESLELMRDKKFMRSYKKSKEQIKKRDFVDWNEL